MNAQTNKVAGSEIGREDREELADTLIAISVIAKRLAVKLRPVVNQSNVEKGENANVKYVRTCCGLR